MNIPLEDPMVMKSDEVAMLLVYLAFSQSGRIDGTIQTGFCKGPINKRMS